MTSPTPTSARSQRPLRGGGTLPGQRVAHVHSWVTASWPALYIHVYLRSLKEAAAEVKGIDVYFDNEFSMRLQTNKINSLGCMFNSQLYCGETSLVADG